MNETISEQSEVAKENPPSLVVGIGASAGGLDAIERLFDNMPNDTGMAFVIVQHLSPDYKSLMDELLARHTLMPIVPIKDGIRMQANNIYLLPPRNNIFVEDGCLSLIEQSPQRGVNLPIDLFFQSLATDIGKRTVAIILSGTGSDGSRGIPYVHEAGGLVVVQDLDTAGFDGMPRSAATTGIADVICPPDKMPDIISKYAADPEGFERGQMHYGQSKEDRTDRQQLFHLFRRKHGVDFSMYKPTTIDRRLQRRIEMSKAGSLKNYLKVLDKDPGEFDALYHDLLVEVTEFFRDRQAFDFLKKEIVPNMLSNLDVKEEIRIWAPGCATGEEAYSIAMVIRDCAERLRINPRVKIFATDVHGASLDIASLGSYEEKDFVEIPNDMQRFLSKTNNGKYVVAQEIRQMVVFASHDVTRDPPFTRIDLVCCRNLLIYFEPDVQKRVLALFHFALKEHGTLFLGPSETVGELVNEFEVLDQHWRFYQKIRDVRLPEISKVPISSPMLNVVTRNATATLQKAEDEGWIRQTAYEDLLSKYVPPSLLINEFDEVVHSFGDARKLLRQPEGRPTLNVIKMLDGDLKSAVSAALHRAKRESESVAFTGIEADDGNIYNLSVEPWSRGSKSLLLVCFEETDKNAHPTIDPSNTVSFQPNQGSVDRIVELERELDYSRQSLQATVEELETSNEELQSTNEELIASNEELQSTNEELHSVNEELYTVNAEHQRKIGELTLVNNDLNNFMSSSDIGTIFLDLELRIRRFTPSISSAFHVIEQDIGRPIDHIAFNLDSPNLIGNIKTVLERGVSSESEVKNRDGHTYLQRIQPYRTGTGEIQGVVLTFDDITTVVSTVRKLEKIEEELSITQKELQVFAYAVSHDLGTPLRHISSHCSMLEEELQDSLSEEALKDIKIVQDGAQRLREMIDGLLAFSRIYTRGASFQEVHFDTIVTEAIEKCQEIIESSKATVTYNQMPTIHGDNEQLLQLMLALIGNAILYCGDEPPVVHIDSRLEGDFWQISVHDNGLGIDKRHLERVFVIFQRLKFKESVNGLGLGLSIAKRIVERHGGWMWIESGEGKGSTVFFKLPVGEKYAN